MHFADIVAMTGNEHRSAARRRQSLAQLERDAALGRVGRARRWVFAGVAALTAAFAALVSAVAPGRTLSTRTHGVGATTTRPLVVGSTQMPPLASPSALGLQGPGQAPESDPSQAPAGQSQAAPTQAPAPQVSGGGGAVSGGS